METKEAWEKYKIAIDARNLEISLFWQRSLFYWGFILAALVAYSELLDKHKTLSFIVALLGLFLSVSWSMLNRGSKWWQENWEMKIAEIENEIMTLNLFRGGKNEKTQHWWLRASRFSPSKLTIGVSDIFCLFWFGIIVMNICLRFSDCRISEILDHFKSGAYIFLPIILLLLLLLLGECSRGED